MNTRTRPNTNDNLHVLRYRDFVERRLVANRTTLGRWIKAGLFPAPIKLGPNSVAWLASDVEAWLQSKRQSA